MDPYLQSLRQQILANPHEWTSGDIMWAQHGVLRPTDEDVEAYERAHLNQFDVDEDWNMGGDEYGLDSDEGSDDGADGDDTGGGHAMAVDGESRGPFMADDSEVHDGDGPSEGDGPYSPKGSGSFGGAEKDEQDSIVTYGQKGEDDEEFFNTLLNASEFGGAAKDEKQKGEDDEAFANALGSDAEDEKDSLVTRDGDGTQDQTIDDGAQDQKSDDDAVQDQKTISDATARVFFVKYGVTPMPPTPVQGEVAPQIPPDETVQGEAKIDEEMTQPATDQEKWKEGATAVYMLETDSEGRVWTGMPRTPPSGTRRADADEHGLDGVDLFIKASTDEHDEVNGITVTTDKLDVDGDDLDEDGWPKSIEA